MSFHDSVLECRSYRRFDSSKSISREELISFVECARNVPSAGNKQPLKYIIVSEKAEMDRIFPYLLWAGYLKDWPGPEESERPQGYIVMLADKDISIDADTDAGIAGYAMMLAAHEKGIGSCMLGALKRAKLYGALGISPIEYDIPLVLAFGYPAERIVLEQAEDDIKYYRTSDQVHHVPKRPIEEVVIR